MHTIIDPQIHLDEATHTYHHDAHPEIGFTSCTQFIDSFFEPFDAEAIAKNLCENFPKYQGTTPQELMQQWRDNADYGSLVHGEIDAYIRHQTPATEEPSKVAIDWVKKQPWQPEQMASEVILYSPQLKLAGTIDLIVQDPPTGVFTLYDWKTSKTIDRVAYQDKRGLRSVAQDLPHCNYVTYSLQLSLYAHMLEESYGAKVDSIHILHINKEKLQVECLEAQHYAEEIKQMLNDRSV